MFSLVRATPEVLRNATTGQEGYLPQIQGPGFVARGHRPPESQNPIDEQLPALHRQLRPSKSHESLLARGLVPVEQGGSHLVNNVVGELHLAHGSRHPITVRGYTSIGGLIADPR